MMRKTRKIIAVPASDPAELDDTVDAIKLLMRLTPEDKRYIEGVATGILYKHGEDTGAKTA